MSTIVTRADKDSPLTNTEVDANFTNLNTDKVEKSGDTLTGDLAFGDNVKATFGASNDLEIYHDGSSSYITEQGTGNLRISGTNLNLQSTAGDIYLRGINNAEVDIRYDNAIKLATTSSGVDVTGTLVADGLTVDGDVLLDKTETGANKVLINAASGNNSRLVFCEGASATEKYNIGFQSSDASFTIYHSASNSMRLTLLNNGHINFFEDTGTTAKLTWDASDEELQFKDNVKAEFGDSGDFDIKHDGTNTFVVNRTGALTIRNNDDNSDILIQTDDGSGGFTNYFTADGSTGEAILYHYGSEKLKSQSTGIDVTGTLVSDNAQFGTSGISSFSVDLLGDSGSGFAEIGRIKLIRSNYDPTGVAASIDFHRGGNPSDGAIYFSTNQGVSGDNTKHRLGITDDGDIEFYEDTGTTAKLTWDASDEELQFKDNVKAEFGDGSDLQISHNGTNNSINGFTGQLQIANYANDNDVRILTDDGSGGATDYFKAQGSTGEAQLYHYGSEKLATKSTGIDVTGAVTADRLTVTSGSSLDNIVQVFGGGTIYAGLGVDGTGAVLTAGSSGAADADLIVKTSTGGTETQRARFNDNGDISFYEDTGTTAKFFWDSSTERLGIGNVAPATTLDVTGTVTADGATIDGTLNVTSNALNLTSSSPVFTITDSDTSAYHQLNGSSSFGSLFLTIDRGSSGLGGGFYIQRNANTPSLLIANSTGDISFYEDTGTSQNFYWDASTSRLGLGTTSPGADIHVSKAVPNIRWADSGASGVNQIYQSGSSFVLDCDPTNLDASSKIIFKVDNSEQMRIDSSGRLGIGTTAPLSDIHIAKSAPIIRMQDTDNDSYAMIMYNTASGGLLLRSDENQATGTTGSNIIFETDSSEAMRIDSSGRLGIGTTTPATVLHVENGASSYAWTPNARTAAIIEGNNSSGTTLSIVGKATGYSGIFFGDEAEEASGQILYDHTVTAMRFATTTAEKMRLDSSGNLLVGTTDNSPENNSSGTLADDGIALMNAGYISACNYGAASLFLNRTSTDGTIVDFRKNGATVGFIGTNTGQIYIGRDDTGIRFTSGDDALLPVSANSGALRSGAIDLGRSYSTFRNLYLSGGVYLGGTGSANLLNDYEEGTFTADIKDSNDNLAKITVGTGKYTKIGNVVTVTVSAFVNSVSQTFTGYPYIDFPFAVANGRDTQCSVAYLQGVGTAQTLFVSSDERIKFATDTVNPSGNIATGVTFSGNLRCYFQVTLIHN